MKLILNKKNFIDNPENLLKRAGYGYIYSRATGHGSFVRRLTRDHYPRLHMYVEERGDQIFLSLHLDQKRASYKGSHAHNAEYDGEVVEREIKRLQEVIGGDISGSHGIKRIEREVRYESKIKNQNSNLFNEPSAEEKLGQGNYEDGDEVEKKKSWWKKFFKKIIFK